MGRGMYQVQRNGQRPINNGVEGGNAITLPMAQVPTIPHNVNLLNFIDDSDNACEVAPVKRTRASQKENLVPQDKRRSLRRMRKRRN